jgi:hypothetical protein
MADRFCVVMTGPPLHGASMVEWINYFPTRTEAETYAQKKGNEMLSPMMVCQILSKLSHKMAWEDKEE